MNKELLLRDMKSVCRDSKATIDETQDYGVEKEHLGIFSILQVFINAIENGEYE